VIARLLPPTMTLRSHLLALVLVTLVPVLIFSAVMVVAFARHERAAVERGSRETARAMSAAVDQQIEGAMAALSALGLSSRLARGDLRGFYEEARALKVAHESWESVFLYDASGDGLLDTHALLGARLPFARDQESFGRLLATRRPVVSDLTVGRVVGQQVVLVAVPLEIGGELRYVLGASVDVQHGLRGLLERQQIPSGWTAWSAPR
jgi:hypothetical protein